MKLLLIRHAESEHNVRGLLAGSTDSALTNHGLTQTQKLGQRIAKEAHDVKAIFASDLKRAKITAEAIRDEQVLGARKDQAQPLDVTLLPILREQDFGSQELQPWTFKQSAQDNDKILLDTEKADYREKETYESMKSRCNAFLDGHLLSSIHKHLDGNSTIVVVSHGLILSALWNQLLLRFSRKTVTIGPQVMTTAGFRPLEHLPSWSNTGYLELEIGLLAHLSTTSIMYLQEPSAGTAKEAPSRWRMTVLKMNCTEHLKNLKRTRGGVGSATHDSNQRRLEGFFAKKPKKEINSE